MAITSDQYLSLVRGALNIGGGILVTKGVLSGGDLGTIAGIIMPLASLVWGWVVHDPVNVVAKAADLKAKGVVFDG